MVPSHRPQATILVLVVIRMLTVGSPNRRSMLGPRMAGRRYGNVTTLRQSTGSVS